MLGPILLWLLATELIGIAVLPLCTYLFRSLPDRGFASAKIVGLLLVSYIAWVTAILGITAFDSPTLVFILVVLGLVSWRLWHADLRRGWSEARALAIGAELVFLVVFAVAVAVRAYGPAIAGQEKQMDFTFVHALVRTNYLPAPDLWLAGYSMPYYYFGYLVQSIVMKVMPIDPVVGYNLALASVLALSATGAFGIGASLSALAGARIGRSISLGVLGAMVLTIMGNLEALFHWIASQGFGSSEFWQQIGIKGGMDAAGNILLLEAHSNGFPPHGGWWFNAARVIPNIKPDGITEFPFFSLLLGDLHPHYMAIPLGILILALGCQYLTQTQSTVAGDGPDGSSASRSAVDPLVHPVVSAVVLGAVIPSNTWDVPVFWGFFALAGLAGSLKASDQRSHFLTRVKQLGLIFTGAVVCYSPYFIGYVSQPLGVGLVEERTYFGTLFVLFGPFLVLALGAAACSLWSASGRVSKRLQLGTTGCAVAGWAVLTLVREPTLGFLVASLLIWMALTWTRIRDGTAPAATLTALLSVIGLGSILVAEVVFLRDLFGSRMNTVFKFYYDAWIVLALTSPLWIWELAQVLRVGTAEMPPVPNPPPRGREETGLWVRGLSASVLAMSAVLMLAGCIYPVAATSSKSGGFAGPPTLDGLSYLKRSRPDDVAAIEWLRRNQAGARVLEAVGDDYTDAARVSTFAGVPGLVGWVGHEIQWRGQNPDIDRRKELARRIYMGTEGSDWRGTLMQLGIEYVFVGSLERELYGPGTEDRIALVLKPVHQSGGTTIYRVARDG